jgi:hypothetical protein
MPFVVVIVGVILVITAFNNKHGDFGAALAQDIPGFFKWGAALAAIGALGFVPGIKTPSRWLLALVMLVIFLHNYANIIAGFKNFAGSGGTASGGTNPTPTAAFTASAGQSTAAPTPQQIAGDSSTATPATSGVPIPSSLASLFGLGGTGATGTTGGTGTATPTGVPGLPNTSLSNFFGLAPGGSAALSQIESGFGGSSLFGT